MNEAEVGEHDDVLTVIGDRVWTGGIDDDRSVMAFLFLQARVTVIPVGAGLFDREFVDERLAWANARKETPGTPSISIGTRRPCQ